MDIIQAIGTFVLGGGFLGFLEFLIHRKDERDGKHSAVLIAINKLEEKIDKIEAKTDERNAITARVRILRFADDMYSDRKHSKDSWDQCMSDITTYTHYCDTHPEFQNDQTEATANYIRDNYRERLEKHDFL